MEIFDLFAVLLTLALGLAGVGAVGAYRKYKREHDARQLGQRNLNLLITAQATNCVVCGNGTDPRTDLLVGDSWYHPKCAQEVLEESGIWP